MAGTAASMVEKADFQSRQSGLHRQSAGELCHRCHYGKMPGRRVASHPQ
jgi:hypothetical protein